MSHDRSTSLGSPPVVEPWRVPSATLRLPLRGDSATAPHCRPTMPSSPINSVADSAHFHPRAHAPTASVLQPCLCALYTCMHVAEHPAQEVPCPRASPGTLQQPRRKQRPRRAPTAPLPHRESLNAPCRIRSACSGRTAAPRAAAAGASPPRGRRWPAGPRCRRYVARPSGPRPRCGVAARVLARHTPAHLTGAYRPVTARVAFLRICMVWNATCPVDSTSYPRASRRKSQVPG